MATENIIGRIREELMKTGTPEGRESGRRFFKEEVNLYGLKAFQNVAIAKKYFADVSHLPKQEIWSLCEEFWKSGYLEETFIACEWSYLMRKHYEPADFLVFEHWVSAYLDNWASCDTLCNHTIGEMILKYPHYLVELKRWALSPNRWMRRAAAVSLIVPARKGLFLDDIFEIAGILLTDHDDMVQKGYGWMLKVASQAHCQEVFQYVMSHKHEMPRTALRYAIEKMPAEMKRQAMEKNRG